MATFTYTPSFEATEASKPRVSKIQYGDGYEMRATFGLNVDPKEWTLTFSERTDTERDNITTFLKPQVASTVLIGHRPAEAQASMFAKSGR